MQDVSELLEQEEERLPTKDELTSISKLAQLQLSLINDIAAKEAELADLKLKLKQVQEIDLPMELEAVGLEMFKLSTGEQIEIDSGYAGSISKKNEPKAFKWLEENGYDALIKNTFTIKFGKGEKENAEELMKLLQEHNVSYSNKENVHAQTLKAFIKEVMAKQALGEIEVPEDVFSIYRWKKAKITR